MNEDMRAEVLEMCVNACEKHTSNNENAAKMVKEQLDKRCVLSCVGVVTPEIKLKLSWGFFALLFLVKLFKK